MTLFKLIGCLEGAARLKHVDKACALSDGTRRALDIGLLMHFAYFYIELCICLIPRAGV